MLGTILLIILILILIGALPNGRTAAAGGYYPSSGAGLSYHTVVLLMGCRDNDRCSGRFRYNAAIVGKATLIRPTGHALALKN